MVEWITCDQGNSVLFNLSSMSQSVMIVMAKVEAEPAVRPVHVTFGKVSIINTLGIITDCQSIDAMNTGIILALLPCYLS